MAFTYDIENDAFYKKGVESGIATGEYRNALTVAKRCLAKGMDLLDIAEISGLSIEELKKIAEKD